MNLKTRLIGWTGGPIHFTSRVRAATAHDHEFALEVRVQGERPVVWLKETEGWLALSPENARKLAAMLVDATDHLEAMPGHDVAKHVHQKTEAEKEHARQIASRPRVPFPWISALVGIGILIGLFTYHRWPSIDLRVADSGTIEFSSRARVKLHNFIDGKQHPLEVRVQGAGHFVWIAQKEGWLALTPDNARELSGVLLDAVAASERIRPTSGR